MVDLGACGTSSVVLLLSRTKLGYFLKKIQLSWLSLSWQAARLSHYVAISAINVLLIVFAFES
jgi:hypothetical protein